MKEIVEGGGGSELVLGKEEEICMCETLSLMLLIS